MSTVHRLSPLLRARPDFLGVALSGDNFSIFHEMLIISDLSSKVKHTCSSDTFHDKNQTTIDSETLSDDEDELATSCGTLDDEHPTTAENSPCDKTEAGECDASNRPISTW